MLLKSLYQSRPALTVSSTGGGMLQQTTMGDLNSCSGCAGRQFPSHNRFVRRIVVPVGKPSIGQRMRRIDFEKFAVVLEQPGAAVGIRYALLVRHELPFSARTRVHLPHGHLVIAARAPLHRLIAIDERLKYPVGRSGNFDFADNSILIGGDSCGGQWHPLEIVELSSLPLGLCRETQRLVGASKSTAVYGIA